MCVDGKIVWLARSRNLDELVEARLGTTLWCFVPSQKLGKVMLLC